MNYFIILAIILNILAFVAFGIDKYLAIFDKRRIREKILLLLAICGGSIGAIAAQKIFRHKTQKFKGILWIILLSHIILFWMIIMLHF